MFAGGCRCHCGLYGGSLKRYVSAKVGDTSIQPGGESVDTSNSWEDPGITGGDGSMWHPLFPDGVYFPGGTEYTVLLSPVLVEWSPADNALATPAWTYYGRRSTSYSYAGDNIQGDGQIYDDKWLQTAGRRLNCTSMDTENPLSQGDSNGNYYQQNGQNMLHPNCHRDQTKFLADPTDPDQWTNGAPSLYAGLYVSQRVKYIAPTVNGVMVEDPTEVNLGVGLIYPSTVPVSTSIDFNRTMENGDRPGCLYWVELTNTESNLVVNDANRFGSAMVAIGDYARLDIDGFTHRTGTSASTLPKLTWTNSGTPAYGELEFDGLEEFDFANLPTGYEMHASSSPGKIIASLSTAPDPQNEAVWIDFTKERPVLYLSKPTDLPFPGEDAYYIASAVSGYDDSPIDRQGASQLLCNTAILSQGVWDGRSSYTCNSVLDSFVAPHQNYKWATAVAVVM